MTDSFVEEVRTTREKIAEQFGFDLDKIGAYYMRLQEEHPERLVRREPPREDGTEEE
jgi:hypothetical protein